MKKSTNAACLLSTAAFLLLGTASAQQDAATSDQPAAAAKPAHTRTSKGSQGAALSAPKDKTSYALGMNLAENLKAQSVEIDPNILLKGMKDVLAGGKTLLTV